MFAFIIQLAVKPELRELLGLVELFFILALALGFIVLGLYSTGFSA
jgi:hypothetical protein